MYANCPLCGAKSLRFDRYLGHKAAADEQYICEDCRQLFTEDDLKHANGSD